MSTKTDNFQGLRVVAFESRKSGEMAALIAARGGNALLAPAMREVPLEHNTEVLAFGEKLLAGEIHLFIAQTAVGTTTLFDVLKTKYPVERLRAAFEKVTLVARGPKPVVSLESLGLKASIVVPDPSTHDEIVQSLATLDLSGRTIAIQETGSMNKELADALSRRGARVLRVPVYRWAMPENRQPLREALQAVIEGKVDVVLFTNATQIQHVMQLAQEEGVESEFRQSLGRVVVASVGPVCSHYLDEYGLPMDLEPEQPRMGSLVEEASRQAVSLLDRKRQPAVEFPLSNKSISTDLSQTPFMKACRREATPFTPIWLMRQAGRYMKEYREIRERHSFLELCKDSDLAAEVTVYAVERLGVDAAIIFADILLILEPMGLQLEYAKGDGPIIHNPVRSAGDVERLQTMTDPSALQFVYEAITKTRRSLPPTIPLLGFCGAPFTLASYMIEGQGSRNFIQTKTLMYSDEKAWGRLMEKLCAGLITYLRAQVAAGVQAVQMFDSWVGCLSPEDYRRYVLPYSRQVLRALPPEVPMIHFGTQTAPLLSLMKEAGGSVIGLDWRTDLADAWQRLGNVAVMGNLDPVVLFADIPEIRQRAKKILEEAAGKPGHIFNLGHGVLPNTPVGHVKALVDAVHEMSRRA